MATVRKGTVWHPGKQIVREGVRLDQYAPEDGWLIKPDLSAVSGLPMKYWVVSGNAALLMGQAEIDAVDARETADALDADRTANKARLDDERVLKALALVMLDEINVIRGNAGLSVRTQTQLVNAIKTKVGEI